MAVSYAGALTGASAGASTEAVAVSAAVLVDRSIGHLVQCSYFFMYILVRFLRTYVGLYVVYLLTDLNEQWIQSTYTTWRLVQRIILISAIILGKREAGPSRSILP